MKTDNNSVSDDVKKLDLSVLLGECTAAMVGILQMVNQ
jgi:hypothetical protein